MEIINPVKHKIKIREDKSNKLKIGEAFLGWAFVIPAMLFISIFAIYPFVRCVLLSFYSWDGVGASEFVGLKNFITIFVADRYAHTAIKNTVIFAFFSTFGSILVGFILAVIIDLKVLFWKAYRIIFFITYSISIVAISLLWGKIFEYEGLINTTLRLIGLGKFAIVWLENPHIALSMMIFITIWHYSGFAMIFFLAGMQNINEAINEAAMIDGATTIRRVISVTIPLLKNVFSILVILLLISTFRVFDIVVVMTGGGPAGKTEVISTLIFKYFQLLKLGPASVLALIGLVLSIILAFFYRKFSGYQKL